MKRLSKILLLAIGAISSIATASSWGDPRYYDVVWDGSRYLLGGENGLYTSTDAKTWRSIPNPVQSPDTNYTQPANVYALATNGSVTVGLPWGPTFLRISKDTITPIWLHPANHYQTIYWTGKLFVAIGGADSLAYSPDGSNWTTKPYQTQFGSPTAKVVSGDTGLVLLSHDTAFRSDDGMSWTAIPTRSPVYGIAWIDGRYVLVGASGLFALSTNTRDWIEDPELNASIGAMCASYQTDTTLLDIAKIGDRLLLLNNAGMMTIDDFGKWKRLQTFSVPYPDFWIKAGQRVFSLWASRIWSSDGSDALVGVIDSSPSASPMAAHPRATGLRTNAHIVKSNLHLDLADATNSVNIEIVSPAGGKRAIANGTFPAGTYDWKLPDPGGASWLHVRTNGASQTIPFGKLR